MLLEHGHGKEALGGYQRGVAEIPSPPPSLEPPSPTFDRWSRWSLQQQRGLYEWAAEQVGAAGASPAHRQQDHGRATRKLGDCHYLGWPGVCDRNVTRGLQLYAKVGCWQQRAGVSLTAFPRRCSFGTGKPRWKWLSGMHTGLVGCSRTPPGLRNSWHR